MTTATKKPKRDVGYTNIRVSKKAYNALVKRSISEKRTLIATLELLLGV